MVSEPLQGMCFLKVTKRRTKFDWAYVMKDILDHYYPDADKIMIVMDNFNPKKPQAFMNRLNPKRLCD